MPTSFKYSLLILHMKGIRQGTINKYTPNNDKIITLYRLKLLVQKFETNQSKFNKITHSFWAKE